VPTNVTAGAAKPVMPEAGPPRGTAFFIVKLALSVLAVGAICYTVDFVAAWRQLSQFNPWLGATAGLAILVQIALGGMRWKFILQRLGAAFAMRAAIRLFYISVFFNMFVWGAVSGDVLRSWLTYRAGVIPADAVNSVILDRVAAIAGVALLMLGTLPWLLTHATHVAIPIAFGAAGVAIFAGMKVVSQLKLLPAAWLAYRPMRFLQGLGDAIEQVLLKPTALPVYVTAVLAQSALAVATYLLALALGVGVGLIDCLALMQPVALLTALPISIGGWGVREAAMIGLFGLVDVPAAKALLLSVSLGLVATVVTLPGGLVWLFWRSSDASRDMAA
jgi:glycosyltransferase 2 family protein